MNIKEIMEKLFERRVKDLPPEALAEVFDRLIWCLDDNGAEIFDVKKKWIEGSNFEKCAIALHMNETFPYDNVDEMKARFEDIVLKWPELSGKCEQIINQRTKQNV